MLNSIHFLRIAGFQAGGPLLHDYSCPTPTYEMKDDEARNANNGVKTIIFRKNSHKPEKILQICRRPYEKLIDKRHGIV